MKRSKRVEFLIIGGGPAGSAAAIILATAGREVVVVERTDYSGPRVGETLPPAANPIIARLGLTTEMASTSHLRCPGTVCWWGDENPYLNDFLFDPDGDGFHLDRVGFDAMMARKAADAGATLLVGYEVRSCCLGDGGWIVTIAGPCGSSSFLASTLIDAAGRRPWRGRPSRRRVFDRQVALVGTFEVDRSTAADRRTWIEAVQSGWWYSASLPENRLAVAYFTDSDLLDAPKENRSARWDALLGNTRMTRNRLRIWQSQCEFRIVAASSTIADPIVGKRYVAIGDAASTIDPLSSHGILYALSSGIAAAETFITPNRSQAIRAYARGIVAQLGRDFRTRQQFCQLEWRWPSSPFWRRRIRA